MKYYILIYLAISSLLYSQNNTGVFVEKKNDFYNKLLKESNEFNEKKSDKKSVFKVDFKDIEVPKSKDEFTQVWHNNTLSQGLTGTCWCFSTTSMFESEIFRIHKKKVKLSELFTVYYEYIDKAKRYVKERSNSNFAQGSEADAVIRVWKEYGVVPAYAYSGLLEGQLNHDHTKMFQEMSDFLNSIKQQNMWNEEFVISTIKSILNKYITEPPQIIEVEGKKITPKQYLEEVIKINPDDYVSVISLKQYPYFKKCIYEVPDNWWLSNQYYNVPLDDFMDILKNALEKGYSVSIGGDVSEAGYDAKAKSAIVPSFDIPSNYINEDSRQFRFSNGTTEDDHGIHLCGYKKKDGKYWFLIKDSAADSRNYGDIGYYFYTEDYIKLKMIEFLVHKDIIKDIIMKFK